MVVVAVAAPDTPVGSCRRRAVFERLLATGDLGSPESVRNADPEGAADSAGVTGRAAVVLEGKILPEVSVDRKVLAVQIDPRPVDPEKNDCPVGAEAVLVGARLWDHYLLNFWGREEDLAVAPESPAVVRGRLASPAEEQLVLRIPAVRRCARGCFLIWQIAF